MKIREVRWRRYALPFLTPFHTAHGRTTHREGLIIEFVSDDGLTGLGDAAPLPEFGGGDVIRAETLLCSLVPDLVGCDLDAVEQLVASTFGDHPETAALRCGIDTALLDLESRARGFRLADRLFRDAARSVTVNATIGEPDSQEAIRAARDAVVRGFGTVKLKVGVAALRAEEIDRVAAVRTAIGPGIRLRLDANGVWQVDQAVAMLRELTKFDIEYVEQPVAPNDLDGLAAVRRATDIPVAVDESVTSLASALRVIDADAANVLVIKPMVCGGPRVARRIIERATHAGLQAVVTSSLESGIGVAATLHLAATLPAGSPACGLATLSLLADDLILEPLEVINGCMPVPDGPGLGVVVDETALG